MRIIPPSAFAGFTASCMSVFNISTTPVVTADQLSYLDAGCSGLAAQWVMNLTFVALQRWQPTCIGQTSSIWSRISAEFLNWAPAEVIRALRSAQIENITPAVFAQLSKACVELLSKEGCNGISVGMFKAIPADAFAGLSWDCVSGIQPQMWSYVAFDQFSALKDRSGGALSGESALRSSR